MPIVPKFDRIETDITARQTPFQALSGGGVAADTPRTVQGAVLPMSGAGRQAIVAGQNLVRMGQDMADTLQQMRLRADKARIDGAVNQLDESILDERNNSAYGWANQHGENALQRDSNKSLAEEYLGRYDQVAARIEQSLGNDTQKAIYRKVRAQRRLALEDGLMRHANREMESYQDSVFKSQLAIGQKMIVSEDPEESAGGIGRIRSAVEKYAKLYGYGKDWQNAQMTSAVSASMRDAILARVDDNDIAAAGKMLSTYSPYLDGHDEIQAKQAFSLANSLNDGKAAAQKLLQDGQVSIDRTGEDDPYRAWNGGFSYLSYVDKLIQSESSGNANAQNPRSSASGIAQFLDTTWLEFMHSDAGKSYAKGRSKDEQLELRNDPAAARAGLKWLTNRNAQVLRDRKIPLNNTTAYLAHLLGANAAAKVYDADPDTNVSSLVGNAAIKANPFMNGMSAQDLITWAGDRMGVRPPMVTEPSYVTKTGTTTYRAASTPELPRYLNDKALQSVAKSRFDRDEHAQKAFIENYQSARNAYYAEQQEQHAAALQQGYERLAQGGHLSDLPATVQAALSGQDRQKLFAYQNKLYQGEQNRISRTGLDVYLELSDPKVLERTPMAQLWHKRSELGDEYFKSLVKQKRKLDEDRANGTQRSFKLNDAWFSTLMMEELGINIKNPETDDKAGIVYAKERLNQLGQEITDAYAKQGKTLTEPELYEMLRPMMRETLKERHWWGSRDVNVFTAPMDKGYLDRNEFNGYKNHVYSDEGVKEGKTAHASAIDVVPSFIPYYLKEDNYDPMESYTGPALPQGVE